MRESIKAFQGLTVWQKAHQLILEIYKITKEYPPEERFGLVSQIRRAFVSVPANIVEGLRKRGIKDKINFYNIAQGSLDELYYYVILSKDLGYITGSNSSIENKIEEVARMLTALIKSVRINNEPPLVPIFSPLTTTNALGRIQ